MKLLVMSVLGLFAQTNAILLEQTNDAPEVCEDFCGERTSTSFRSFFENGERVHETTRTNIDCGEGETSTDVTTIYANAREEKISGIERFKVNPDCIPFTGLMERIVQKNTGSLRL